ncbi:DNA-directed RNA polymerase III subunit RPC10-like protein [Carex littledalei]|uniref:DNA-directed RNA polymerase subunit n=1 Tax=Carex littledalei TaxID=544730 RepID=A0A833V9N5_9POAL|nr:DNA-directed RNA polymerase III subunit RPC10-like protein [Carex littledalei]
MDFCPWCGMMLQIESASSSRRLCLSCPVCPYYSVPVAKIEKEIPIVKKEVEPIFSGADEMKFAPKTKATCPRCHNGEAYFRQMQIRSADEPMTTFYKCCNDNCRHDWRED